MPSFFSLPGLCQCTSAVSIGQSWKRPSVVVLAFPAGCSGRLQQNLFSCLIILLQMYTGLKLVWFFSISVPGQSVQGQGHMDRSLAFGQRMLMENSNVAKYRECIRSGSS